MKHSFKEKMSLLFKPSSVLKNIKAQRYGEYTNTILELKKITNQTQEQSDRLSERIAKIAEKLPLSATEVANKVRNIAITSNADVMYIVEKLEEEVGISIL